MPSRPMPAVGALYFCLLFFSVRLVSAAEDFDCRFDIDGRNYDLSSLAGEHKLSRSYDSPPTKTEDVFRWDLCADLKPVDGVSDEDQCLPGTRACMTRTNTKGSESGRVVQVVPIAVTSSLKPEYSPLSSGSGVSLIFHGQTYPSPDSDKVAQSASFDLRCADGASDPKLLSYDGSLLHIEWSTPAACAKKGPSAPSDGKASSGRGMGSGLGYFFIVLLIAFAAYFVLGAYYNYSTYGASGSDLIPHRDFWREVPYMLRDVVSHLFSAFSSKHSSRGGYIAV